MKLYALLTLLATVATVIAQPAGDSDRRDDNFIINGINSLQQLLHNTNEDYLEPLYDRGRVILTNTKDDLIDFERDGGKDFKKEAHRDYHNEANLVECLDSFDQKSHENLKQHIEDLETAFDNFKRFQVAYLKLLAKGDTLKTAVKPLISACLAPEPAEQNICMTNSNRIWHDMSPWQEATASFVTIHEQESPPELDEFRKSASSINAHFETSFNELVKETLLCLNIREVELDDRDRYRMFPN